MEKYQEHVDNVATSTQELQTKLMKDLGKFFTDFLKNFEKQKGDQKAEQKVEIQRDGKTIASGVMRDGQIQDVKGKIPAADLTKLKEAIGADRGAQIGDEKAKEFKILVNHKPLLHTHRGIVLQNDLPQKMRDQFRAAAPTAEKPKTTAASATKAAEKPKTATAATPIADKDKTAAPTTEKPGLQPAQAPAVDLRTELKKAGVDERTIAEVERQVTANKGQSPVEPSSEKTGQSPSAIVQKTLPKESPLHRVMFALRQAADKVGDLFQGGTARSLKQDLRNLEVTQEAKMSLSQLSDRPPGQRSWSGNTYQLTEGKNGEFAIEAKGRGKILEFSKGRVEGNSTEADLKNFKTLNQEITKYNAKERAQQPQLAGGIER